MKSEFWYDKLCNFLEFIAANHNCETTATTTKRKKKIIIFF